MANLIISHPIQVIFIHCKPRITTEIRGLQLMQILWKNQVWKG